MLSRRPARERGSMNISCRADWPARLALGRGGSDGPHCVMGEGTLGLGTGYQFPRAAITRYHILGGLKQQALTVS